MYYRKLLLPISGSPGGQAALDLGIDLARTWRAHLAATIVSIDAASVAPLAGEGLSGAMIEDMMAATERESAGRAQGLETLFMRAVKAAGIRVGLPSGAAEEATAALTIVKGRDDEVMPGLARLSDLTILPHPDHEDDPGAGSCLHAVLFDSARPVLIAGVAPSKTLGTRCCVAWNGTPESAAAMWAMLPWLKQAQAVRLLHAAEYQRRGPGAAAAIDYLRLHGITAEAAEFRPRNRDVGAGLLAAATEFGADLLGMGAYSHSRLRQLILGGVTRHVLGHAAMPLLMAH